MQWRTALLGETRSPMKNWFQVQHLDVERLLAQWRWLCPGPKKLVACSAFGHMFLADESGHIWWLDVDVGALSKIADSELDFRNLLADPEKRDEWFGDTAEQTAASKGLIPNEGQCVGFEIPLVFKVAGPSKPYLIDIYENVSFLGDLNEQIANVPDGGKVKLVIGARPSTSH